MYFEMHENREDPGDWTEALKPESLWTEIREIEEKIRWNQSNADLYLELGIFYGCLKDGDQEVKAYRKALELDPGMQQAHYLLGEHYFAKKKYWDAAMEFGHYVLGEPEDSDGTLYLKFAIACLRLGWVDDAKRHLDKSRLDKGSGRAGVAEKLLSRIS
jgi:tetratricopeptide (TPR) repeat protein